MKLNSSLLLTSLLRLRSWECVETCGAPISSPSAVAALRTPLDLPAMEAGQQTSRQNLAVIRTGQNVVGTNAAPPKRPWARLFLQMVTETRYKEGIRSNHAEDKTMALSPAEKQKAYRERQKMEQWLSQDSTYGYLETPFFKHLENDGNWSSVTLAFEMLGIESPEFEDDRGPEAFAFDHCFSSDEQKLEAFASHPRSIGRADAMVGILLDAASELAGIIRNYKLSELDARLKELAAMDLSDPATKKRVLRETVRIEKIKDALGKTARRPMPQWEVKGI